MVPTTWLAAVSLASAAVAQYFPPTPKGLKVVNSKHEKGVKISYKEVGSPPPCSLCDWWIADGHTKMY